MLKYINEIERARQQAEDYRAGMICATLVNMWSKGKRYEPDDFFSSLKELTKQVAMTEEDIAQHMMKAFPPRQ